MYIYIYRVKGEKAEEDTEGEGHRAGQSGPSLALAPPMPSAWVSDL